MNQGELLQSLYFYLNENEYGPTGDLMLENETMRVFWSPGQWISPPDALKENRDDWLYLGMEGWWPNPEMKKLYEKVKQWAGELWPQYPGEWCRLDDIGWDWQI